MLIINSIKIRRHTSCHGVGCFKLNFVRAEGAELAEFLIVITLLLKIR